MLCQSNMGQEITVLNSNEETNPLQGMCASSPNYISIMSQLNLSSSIAHITLSSKAQTHPLFVKDSLLHQQQYHWKDQDKIFR